MANPIWKIGLFTKLSKDKAECNECKKAGLTKYLFELSNGSVKSLVTHMNTKLHALLFIRVIFAQRLSIFCCFLIFLTDTDVKNSFFRIYEVNFVFFWHL
jgi:hypothetical protein